MQEKVLIMNQENALEVAEKTRYNVRAILNNEDKEKQRESIDLLIRLAVMKAYTKGFDSCHEQIEKNKKKNK